jgi:hypothetical protein
MTRLWVDMGDLLSFAAEFRRPSGIQRVLFELGGALRGLADRAEPGFVVSGAEGRFEAIAWQRIAETFHHLATDTRPSRAPRRSRLAAALRCQGAALLAAARIAPALLVALKDSQRQRRLARSVPQAGPMAPGDVLLVAGAGWAEAGHIQRVHAARLAGAARGKGRRKGEAGGARRGPRKRCNSPRKHRNDGTLFFADRARNPKFCGRLCQCADNLVARGA